MDRSFGASFLGSRTPFSPKTRLNESRRSGFRKSTRLSLSGKSAQSINQILLRSQNYFVESYGQPLPVLITEALTFSERTTPVSANLAENGYAWLVCGRRVLIWQYRQPSSVGTPQRKGTTNQCIELKLPQSDLAHKAELVTVFIQPNSHSVSCIASSPEGVVRYWPSIAHEGVSIEECVDLQGQECDSLTETDGLGCILVTTTCTTVLLQPQVNIGRHVLNCKILKMPTGWLGGIGKRMSSLIFGPISSEQSAETRMVRVLKVPINEKSRYVFVLTGHTLHKWKLTVNETEQYLYALDLNVLITGECFGSLLEHYNKNQSNADIWILDMQANKNNIILLVAGAQTSTSPQVHYALAYIDLYAMQAPNSISKISILKLTGIYRENNPTDHLSYRCILIEPCSYIYNKRNVVVACLMDEPDILEFSSPHDYLLCGCVCMNTPIFFTRNYGLVSVCHNDRDTNLNVTSTSLTAMNDTQNESNAGNLTLYNIDPDEILSAFKDIAGQLKAAFIYHVQNQYVAAKEILDEIFPYDGTTSANSTLDKVALHVCSIILNDSPTGDPRWNRDNTVGIGSSYSMQIIKQLEDKQKALTLYYRFLKDMGLWSRLSCVVERESTICTTYMLGEHFEKLVAAFVLKSYPSTDILERAIERAVEDTEIDTESGLTAQDVFYKNVTKIHKGLQEVVSYCEHIVNSVINPMEIGNIIVKSNEIILTVLEQVLQQRQQNASNYVPNEDMLREYPEYLPWTIANGSEGLHDALVLQQSLTYNYGIRNTSTNSLHNTMLDQLVYLIDIIIDGRKSHLQSTVGTDKEQVLLKQYQKDRHNLIYPFVFERQWDRAALLAEKYLDFETLVNICERTKNERRLDDYIDRFSNEGFPQYLLTWFLQENKQAELINKCKALREGKHSQVLSNFLSDHPSLSWIQLINNEDFSKAADTLQHLAMQETDSLRRQKTMLSLSKLAKLASPNGSDDLIPNVNSSLELVELQEGIPDYVLQQFGYDTIKPCVIPPIKLIHLYTCPEYSDATELEFKKALDILPYVDQETYDECKLEIWKRAILRDTWNEKSLDSPLEILQNKLLFKLGELTSMLGSDLHSVLPPIDVLAEDANLQFLHKHKSFQFLLKTAYEQFAQINKVIDKGWVGLEYPEYLPWTIANGSEGLHDALVLQLSLTYNYGIQNTSTSSLHNTMRDQLVYLIDIIIDGRKSHLQSTVGTDKEQVLLKQYQKDRHNLIYPFVFERQWDRAALLAEKYLDFETLVNICERTKNERRLDNYIDRFSNEYFPQYLLTWFLQENKQAELINKCKALREGKHSQVLSNLLSDHPSLSWIQLINNEDFSKAADTLQHLAMQETDSLRRQKTVLSLSKLAKLASPNGADDLIPNVNSSLKLVELQEGIPDYVLQQFGYDTIKPCVIPPIKLIHLYTCPEYSDATELEFKKALDILPYLDKETYDECKLEIWKRAILRDTWNEKSLDSPLEILQNKLLFKLGELTSMLGSDLHSVLPPIDVLAEDASLQFLHKHKSFQFLLKTAYEQFAQM